MGRGPFVESSSLSRLDIAAMIGGTVALTAQGLKHLDRPLISLRTTLALVEAAKLLTGCRPGPVETTLVSNINVINIINAGPQQISELNNTLDNFQQTASSNKLNYPGDENNPVKQGGLRQVVAAALNVNENIIDPNNISVSYPEEIEFGNNQTVKLEYVEYSYNDENNQPQKKVIIFGSDKDGQWGLVGLTNEPFVIQSLPNAGVVANSSDGKQLQQLFTGFPPNTQIPFTGIFISGGKNGAVFSSALYFTQDDGGIRMVFRNNNRVFSGPVPNDFKGTPSNNPEGVFNTSFKLASLNQIIPPVSPATPINTPTPKPTETPTATAIATPTEVPLPSQFLAQVQEHGFPYEVVDGKVMVNSTDGKSLEIDPNQIADWPMWEDSYLVIKGDNGIPQLRYVEGKGWEKVEQTSKIDALGNNVSGWVVETSAVWEGEPPYWGDFNRDVFIASLGFPEYGQCSAFASGYLKQWKLLEFMASDGTKMQSLQIDFVFNNGKQVITARSQTGDIDMIIGRDPYLVGVTPKQLMEERLIPGKKISPHYWWGDLSSTVSPEDAAMHWFNYYQQWAPPRPEWLDKHPCVTELGCAMDTGQVGANKFPLTYLRDIFSGNYGEFVDLSYDTQMDLSKSSLGKDK